MSDFVSKIRLAAPPPAEPFALDFEWADVERHLGLVMPADFKDLISCYGRGVFESSAVRLCNYLDGHESIIDQFTLAAECTPGVYEAYSFFPKANGLIPLASLSSTNFLLFDTSQNPWTIVLIDENRPEDAETFAVSASEAVFGALYLERDQSVAPLAKLISSDHSSLPLQRFTIEPHSTPIDDEVARVVATGGFAVSYLISNACSIRLPSDIELRSARREKNVLVDWGWYSANANRTLAPECQVFLEVFPKRQFLATKHVDEILAEYATRSMCELERISGSAGEIHYLKTSNRDRSGREDFELIFVGELADYAWKMRFQFFDEHASRFFAIAESAAKSLFQTQSQA